MSKYFDRIEKKSDYLYEVWYSKMDYEYADWYFQFHNPIESGGCTSVRKGNYFGRNYDWVYSEDAEFVVHTEHTVGVAGFVSPLTKEFVESGEESDSYAILPFCLKDGINDSGVTCSVNVVPHDYEGNGVYEAAIEERVRLCSTMVIRYVLDNFTTAKSAAEYLRDYATVYMSKNVTSHNYEVHFMIADSTKTYLVEFVEDATIVSDVSSKAIITNFYINGVEFESDGSVAAPALVDKPTDSGLTPHAAGLERYNIVNAAYDSISSAATMRDALKSVYYTHTYLRDNGDWYSEVAEGGLTIDSRLVDLDYMLMAYANVWPQRSRDVNSPYYGFWHTAHSSVYDIANKSLSIVAQENSKPYDFKLGGNGMQDLLQIGSSHNRPVRTFYCDSEAEVLALPKNIPAGSVAELLDGTNGLRVFMLRKTSDDPNNGTWEEI